MNRKHTIESVCKIFADQNCQLLETHYENTRTPLQFRCGCGNVSRVRLNDFVRGTRCKKCGNEKGIKSRSGRSYNKKYTLESVQKIFADNNCQLLEDHYESTSVPVKFRCSCGNTSCVAVSDFKRGIRCRKCGSNKTADKIHARLSAKILNFFRKEGCTLLSEYVDGDTPLQYTCKCGREGNTLWFYFKRGRRCGYCSEKRNKKYSIDEVKEIFADEGCKLLSTIYVNNITPIEYQCSCGRASKITVNNFKKGMRCMQCGLDKMTGPNNHRWIPDRDLKNLNDTLRDRCLGMLHKTLKSIGEIKRQHTRDLLGYGHQELKEHLIKHPNWEKVKHKKWHIDHIFPISAFLEYKIYDIRLINSLDNLQPLTKSENSHKHAKYDKTEFERWLKKKGVECDKLSKSIPK